MSDVTRKRKKKTGVETRILLQKKGKKKKTSSKAVTRVKVRHLIRRGKIERGRRRPLLKQQPVTVESITAARARSPVSHPCLSPNTLFLCSTTLRLPSVHTREQHAQQTRTHARERWTIFREKLPPRFALEAEMFG